MSIYTDEELQSLGFKSIGSNVRISKKASFYGIDKIEIGNNVRIDDFCVLSAGEGGISLGSYIHIAVYSSLIGAGRIILKDFCNISSRVSIYSSNDDYSGEYMTNPMVPDEFTNVSHQDVTIDKHAIIGSGSVILPGIVLGKGAVVGALSLVKKNVEQFHMVVGSPAKFIRKRQSNLLELEKKIKLLNGN